MAAKLTTVRLTLQGEKFELLVKPDPALDFKMGKRTDVSNILASDEIYADANKGTRVSAEKLMKYFKTTDPGAVAKMILERGELNMTAEQRKRLVEDKRKQIVQIISRSYVDPKTHLPHPPTRIENAIEEARVVIDPFKKAEDQIKTIIDELRSILPLKSEQLKFSVLVPAQFAAQSYSILKSVGDLQGEEWQADGSLKAIIEIPAAMQSTLMDRLGSVTKGSAQVTVIR
ncbi:MAG: ribosome assembly factor SBDS [Nitrososphaerales archaeon]